jgi:hypothetical protein
MRFPIKTLTDYYPQETQPEMVETEMHGVPVESRTLPAGCMDGHLPRILGPQKIFFKISYKDYNSHVL